MRFRIRFVMVFVVLLAMLLIFAAPDDAHKGFGTPAEATDGL